MYPISIAPFELANRDKPAIGGYYRRLSSSAPSELKSIE